MALHVIHLTYDEVPITVNVQYINAQPNNPGPKHYEVTAKRTDQKVRHVADTLEWKTSDDDYVTVELRPKCMFSSNLFSTDPDFCAANNIKMGEPVKILEKG